MQLLINVRCHTRLVILYRADETANQNCHNKQHYYAGQEIEVSGGLRWVVLGIPVRVLRRASEPAFERNASATNPTVRTSLPPRTCECNEYRVVLFDKVNDPSIHQSDVALEWLQG
jgi:hypothetical protein